MNTTDVQPRQIGTTAATVGLVIRKLVWVAALVLMALFALNGFMTIALQDSAPQQGAAAAVSCFHMITTYVIARAIDELTRGF